MFGGSDLLGTLAVGGVLTLLAILYWVLRKTDRAMERGNTAVSVSSQAAAFAGSNLQLVQAMQSAIIIQGNTIGKWNQWGSDVQRMWHDLQSELKDQDCIDKIRDLPPAPENVDVQQLFAHLPAMHIVPAPDVKPDQMPGGGLFDKLLGN